MTKQLDLWTMGQHWMSFTSANLLTVSHSALVIQLMDTLHMDILQSG